MDESWPLLLDKIVSSNLYRFVPLCARCGAQADFMRIPAITAEGYEHPFWICGACKVVKPPAEPVCKEPGHRHKVSCDACGKGTQTFHYQGDDPRGLCKDCDDLRWAMVVKPPVEPVRRNDRYWRPEGIDLPTCERCHLVEESPWAIVLWQPNDNEAHTRKSLCSDCTHTILRILGPHGEGLAPA